MGKQNRTTLDNAVLPQKGEIEETQPIQMVQDSSLMAAPVWNTWSELMDYLDSLTEPDIFCSHSSFDPHFTSPIAEHVFEGLPFE